MTDEPTPLKAREKRIVARHPSDHAADDPEQDLQYFALSGADRLKAVKDKIEEREKVFLDLELVEAMLDGNPEPGTCVKKKTLPNGEPTPCQCGTCELDRVVKMKRSVRFAITKLRALHGRLS